MPKKQTKRPTKTAPKSKLQATQRFNPLVAGALAVVFLILGFVIYSAFAANSSWEPESWIQNPATINTIQNDSASSNGKYLIMGTVPTPIPSISPTPPSTAFPTAATTGVPAGTTLTASGSRTITTNGTVLDGLNVTGSITVNAQNVTIKNTKINYSGSGGGGSGAIKILSNASATIDHVEVDGKSAVHACVWHEGSAMTTTYLYCHDVEDGVFSWAQTGTASSGNNFLLENSYITRLNAVESNGHWDGYQTEGAVNGIIRHNNFDIDDNASGSISIWNGQKNTDNILVENNLVSGGGFSIYAEDYHPSEASPVGGYTMTNVRFLNNTFTTKYSSCVGSYGIWFYRANLAYHGGPTGDWGANGNVRSGNIIQETGFNLDNGNPPGCS